MSILRFLSHIRLIAQIGVRNPLSWNLPFPMYVSNNVSVRRVLVHERLSTRR